MDRCALFVDAGYVLTDGAMAVHGTRRRESVSWDYAGLLQLFGNLAMERTRLPLLRCYWYEATVEGRRSEEHDTLADLPGVKLRVAKMRPGRREGVEGEIHRDLTTLARNKAVSDVMVVSAEEDLAQVIADVQDMGMRVTLLHIAAEGNKEIARALRQECDDVLEVSAAHLRPYVELIAGAEPARPDEPEETAAPSRPVNGSGTNGITYHSNGSGTGSNGSGQAPARPVAAPAEQAPRPAAEAPQPDAHQPERQESAVATDFAPVADLAASVDYSASVDYGTAAEYTPAAEYAPPAEQPAPSEPASGPDYGPLPDYATPAPPREGLYAAPVPVPAVDEGLLADRDRMAAAYNQGGARDQYQRDGGYREPLGGEPDGRLQPVPVSVPSGGSAQVRQLHARGPAPVGPSHVQQPPAPQLSAPGPQHRGGPQLGRPQLGSPLPPGGGHQPVGQPTGSQPALPPASPMAPVVPMDPGGMGYGGPRGGSPSGSRPVIAGPGGPVGLAGANGPGGPGGNPGQGGQPGLGPVGPGSQPQQPGGPQGPAGPVGGPQDPGGPSGPIGLVGPGGYPQGAPGVSLGDAVQSAHEEGQAFGESVARDAPALWLEAVLARKPRMPSDLEARLLQGSALPIDFLLHDEVRHALRRGFWDALERARR